MSTFIRSQVNEILTKYSSFIDPRKSFYPLDLFIKRYLQSNKNIGEKDQKIIMENSYKIMRNIE